MSSDVYKHSLSKHRWRVHVRNLETRISVGIHAHEQEKQRVIVNAMVEGIYPAKPQAIGDCFDYEHIYDLVVNKWPDRPHRPLLENFIVELLEHIFYCDDRVDLARVHICKPDIYQHAESVGAETEWTRKDFEKYAPNYSSHT